MCGEGRAGLFSVLSMPGHRLYMRLSPWPWPLLEYGRAHDQLSPPAAPGPPHMGPYSPVKFMAFCFTYQLEWHITLWLIIRIRVSTKDQSAHVCSREEAQTLCSITSPPPSPPPQSPHFIFLMPKKYQNHAETTPPFWSRL